MVLLGLWILAAGDELLQPYVGREASFIDWAADMIGGVGGLVAGSAVLRRLFPHLVLPPAPEATEARRRPRASRRAGARGARRRR